MAASFNTKPPTLDPPTTSTLPSVCANTKISAYVLNISDNLDVTMAKFEHTIV